MPDEWFYKVKDAEIGPITWDELKWLADHGKLDRNALVREGRTGKFLLAKRVKALIDLTVTPPAMPGAQPPAQPPAAKPREHSPTLSFTPAKKRDDIALPPTLQPPQSPSKDKSKPEKPATPAGAAPATPPPKSKPPAANPPISIDDLLPPPAVPIRPPRK